MNTVTNRKGRYGSRGGGWGVAPLQAEQQRRAECATSDNDDPVIVTKHVDTRGEGRAGGGARFGWALLIGYSGGVCLYLCTNQREGFSLRRRWGRRVCARAVECVRACVCVWGREGAATK